VSFQERTYHGLQGRAAAPAPRRGRWGRGVTPEDPDVWHPSRLLVEVPEHGPTEREHVTILDELFPREESDFGWGYNGTGTSSTAAAVLADALEIDIETISFAGERPDETLADLREAFCAEVLTDLYDEWRLNRRAVLRWVADWFHQRGVSDVPAILRGPRAGTKT